MKNKLKKIICVICSSVLIFGLIGCGKAETTDIDNNKAEEETTEMIQTEEDLKNSEPVNEDDLSEKQKNNVEVLTLFNQMIGKIFVVEDLNDLDKNGTNEFLTTYCSEDNVKAYKDFYAKVLADGENTFSVENLEIVSMGQADIDPNKYCVDYTFTLVTNKESAEWGTKEKPLQFVAEKQSDGTFKIYKIS